LRQVFQTVGIVPYTASHERNIEKARMDATNPQNRLISGPNIWNVAAIDNIDFKDQTFYYGNIYDATRSSSHATIRMVFQFTFSEPLETIIKKEISSYRTELELFGLSSYTNKWNEKYDKVFSQFLANNDTDFDSKMVHTALKNSIEPGFKLPAPHVVILKPGPEPNSNVNIYETCDYFWDDLATHDCEKNFNVDIVADEAIFRRLILYRTIQPLVRPFLGQWHTNKAMCSVLIAAFSGYGIFDWAARLGVKFLDKLDSAPDYRSICLTLELMWVAVGIALHKYACKQELLLENILHGNNDVAKVLYLFYRWAGYWKGHKLGIRTGNYYMQMENLAAFAPLFPVTGKNNYSKSVVHFLSYLHSSPNQKALLLNACSVNLTREGHYLAFDEALETYGVKFIKQHISGKSTDLVNLTRQIKALQTEMDRLSLVFSAFIGEEIVNSQTDHAVKCRKECLWQLSNDMFTALNLPDPRKHNLFKYSKELHKKGIEQLLTCYEKGICRLNAIHKQEIVGKAKIDTRGRRNTDVNRYKWSKLESERKKKHDQMQITEDLEMEDLEMEDLEMEDLEQESSETSHNHSMDLETTNVTFSSHKVSRAPRYKYSDDEKNILQQLAQYPAKLSYEEILNILPSLTALNSIYWNEQTVRQYWYRHFKQ